MTTFRRGRGSPVFVVAALILGLVGAGAGAAAYADEEPDDGGGVPIIVTVRPSVPTPAPGSPTPTPTPSPSASPRPGGGPGQGSGSSPAPSVAPIGDENLPTLGDDAFSVGGALYVSGLRTHYFASPNPTQGGVMASFTVRNVSSTTIDSYVSFGLSNFLGQRLSSATGITVLRLEPDETRVIRTTLQNPGQWGVETATYTLTPTSLVDDTRLPSVTREAMVLFVPWLVIVILVVLASGYAIARVVRSNPSRAAPGLALAGESE